MTIDLKIESFEEAIDYAVEMVGSDFEKAVSLTAAIIANPEQYTGPQATISAVKMATYRSRIGLAAQYWKIKSAQTKRLDDRLIKDSLMVMYDSLLEVINVLKITGKHEHEIVHGR